MYWFFYNLQRKKDLFYSIPDEASIAVIPRENSIYGSVVETHDLFRDPKIGKSIHITEEITLQVQHCLLAAHGTELADIKRVFSHEQVCIVLFCPLTRFTVLTTFFLLS